MARPVLRALAKRLGIAAHYVAQTGERRSVSDAAREALLEARGIDASSEVRAREALRALRARALARGIEPVEVVGERSAESARLRVRSRARGQLDWSLALVDENGRRREAHGRSLARGGIAELRLPARLGAGYYELEVRLGDRVLRQRRIAAPASCVGFREKLGDRRALGLWAMLPGLHGERGEPRGDLGTLRELIARAARERIDFIGLEPMHARLPPSRSPYAPLSRLFRDPAYLGGDARVARAGRGGRAARAHGSARLELFATYCALGEALGGFDHRRWPARYRDPQGTAVDGFRLRHAARVQRHVRAQLELERRLGAVAGAARRAGMRLGLYADLAVGSAPGGFDVWAFPGLFARGASFGCPPDVYSRSGQDWGLAPLDPERLRESGFDYWIALLRAAFAHCGALRIDHAMGLRRLFWIPAGGTAREGAYVAYPERELRAILALESRRAGALVIGEDLGTVPAGFSRSLARENILSTRLLYFEQRGGRFRAARRIEPHALVCVRNHDLPPVAGWMLGRDLEIRAAAGALSGHALRAARAQRRRELAALRARLRAEGLLAPRADDPDALAIALAGLAARTRAPLVALGVDDLAGEREPSNVPGLPESAYPGWSKRAALDLRDTFRRPAARAALELARRERRGQRKRNA
jgi:4-alpha-glucanotransferase